MMTDLQKVADSADVIICGFSFQKKEDGIHAFNLNNGYGAAVFTFSGELIETNMDDIELAIARRYMASALKYMEVEPNAEVLSV